MDREKVMEGLEYLITAYAFHGDDAECLGEAIELLEPKKPEIINDYIITSVENAVTAFGLQDKNSADVAEVR